MDGPLDNNFKPFNQPGQQGKALCFRPDIMEMDEERTFPEFKRFVGFCWSTLLKLSNLILPFSFSRPLYKSMTLKYRAFQ